ncbi:MAG: nitrile hydratase subunit alpha [Planktotalea sp.]|jgi:nitrile hydratase|uniref:nitrile hydratase subunit alpha n=1 Tax=Planktotalea sp. TaxID=2029877 RepID=UPI0001839BB1|nr:nitrile hydratase subunit alpha [Planktotalea sp.]EDZ40930.1 nitrile hydratase alpha subunit [Rhodobacteraceae bacterium HTCC2083]MBT5821958.1 nitrile hydratase subunit alpha [Paracoccaceae bacterium]MDG1076311.1 nitrile hydratase subunit alpha [Planktotalea sp.]MDG1084166.1 nitrile hydratase subunit alpha [Planktotalea sp.]HCW86395.1 nitrile hydratase subunit alpha [Paracoccaceae bacterium]
MPHDHHDHLSPSGHPYRADDDTPLSYWQTMEIAVRELLVEKDITTAEEINAQIDAMDARSPAIGAAVVARAWCDPEFKIRLLADASAASREMGFDIGPMHLIALENTADTHNIVVCTLCSCYPRNLLGLPPDWYKSRAYRSRTVKEPRKVLSEFGVTLPDRMRIRVHDSTADMRYVVIPMRPKGTEDLSQDALAALVTRDSMIGTGIATAPTA